ncbi:flagellar biosynthesis anti-sigma factor FlgM [Hydrogenoanaerobacterium sp.]|uniref:flagellar biosynthesis anti-sigma factor FlgM n=1 Tax=Hydrogenoanaerobacterium sp. TaxID=2953763 RepID=UPI00289AADD4|nr:flagellar biosynthesis anti-sigma factor FlgM [Hydrogenoanaerobacterium sp.]
MEIKPTAGYNIYKANMRNTSNPENSSAKSAPSAATGKMDTISISAQGAQQKEAAKLTAAITKEVTADADAAKIDALKKAVQNGTYHIPAEKIAQAILNGLFA